MTAVPHGLQSKRHNGSQLKTVVLKKIDITKMVTGGRRRRRA